MGMTVPAGAGGKNERAALLRAINKPDGTGWRCRLHGSASPRIWPSSPLPATARADSHPDRWPFVGAKRVEIRRTLKPCFLAIASPQADSFGRVIVKVVPTPT